MKIAILGFGKQGQSAYEYWTRPQNQITVCDQNESVVLPQNVQKQLGADYLKGLDQFDLIVRSPSVHPNEIAEANSPGILQKVTSVTNEFIRVCPTKNIIGVTGTKGKGTTTTLIAKMLEAGGMRVYVGGNIGTPPLDLLKKHIQPDDWVILELANFQLIDLNYSPHIGVCLMVVPEHLDWHKDLDEYVSSKQQMFTRQTPNDIAIYYANDENSRRTASLGQGQKIPYMVAPGATVEGDFIVISGQTVCKTSEVKLLGKHNLQNVCAAVTAVWQITKDTIAMRTVATSFSGLPHRLELVRELGKVKYYDDSFGTTPETAMVAIQAFTQPKVVILGGSDKGANFEQLAQAVKDNGVKKVVLIGATAPKIEHDLRTKGFVDVVKGGDNMATIVQTAQAAAQPGDVVLLSTACASFGMFKNYEDRGEQFRQAVLALPEDAQ
jgi:UDP-N-acetylmuramoylalanine--D-glutamate ligase